MIPASIMLLLCFVLGSAQAQEKKVIRISGGGALSDVVQSYSESYMKGAANCSITVTGTTTGIGFKKLFDGEADIVMSTRKITAEEAKIAQEKGLSLNSTYIGQVELARSLQMARIPLMN
jgi:ABC-type phosphate transport system substrate-binding protein